MDEKIDRYLQQLLENDYRDDLLEEIEDSSMDDDSGNPGNPNHPTSQTNGRTSLRNH